MNGVMSLDTFFLRDRVDGGCRQRNQKYVIMSIKSHV